MAGDRMTRRELVAGIAAGAGSSAWPLAARAQQRPPPVVGFLNSGSPGPFAHLAAGFRKGLEEEGFSEGRDVVIDSRWAEGRYDTLAALAQELVDRKVAVLAVTGGVMPALAAKSAELRVPIVFVMGGDPVRLGIVPSLSRPGGHITGVTQLTTELGTKRLGLLHELVPNMRTVGLLLNPEFSDTAAQLGEIAAASRNAGLALVVASARTEEEFPAAFAAMVRERVEGLLIGADPYFNTRRDRIVAHAAHVRVPTMYEFREFAKAGGLASYGTDLADAYRLGGIYAGRVLKGAKPADLPVVQASRYEFLINLKTAKSLELTIPPTLLARADEVIE